MFCAVAGLLVFAVRRRKITPVLGAAAFIFSLYFIIMKWLFPALDIQSPHPDYVFLAICLPVMIAGCVYALRHKLRYMGYILCFFIGSTALTYSVDYVFDRMLKPHQRDRIENLLGVKEDLRGAGYNVHQSKVAIGSGGLTGKGFLEGTQTKYNFVPEQSTDFIFCTIGEEWGFAGSFVVVVCYLVLLLRLVVIAERQKDAFARIYGYCVLSILFFHFAINISMTIGLAPVVGIPLPFLSYGGSSLWAFTILLFILLKLDAVRWD
jgi:rod shape determining protein RodA